MPDIYQNSVISTPGITNCFFSWGPRGSMQVLQTRCNGIGYGFDVVAEESHARQTRAFYPRQVAEQNFAITLELKGYREFQGAMEYFRRYTQSFMVAANNSMYVVVPSRRFVRLGVPTGGMADGDHVGSNVFSPTLIFESVYDPADPDLISNSSNTSQYSKFDRSSSEADSAGRFFYPASADTNDPNATGDLLYGSDSIGQIGSGIFDLISGNSLKKGG
jgi:hypothetical protein